ncbi:MAG: hypothetical protein IJE08_04125 [Clostridia bacterium]|nr:hypothetical protein [Clostridia bacterium]
MIAAGCKHSVGLSENGALATAGWNQDGQCDVSHWRLWE